MWKIGEIIWGIACPGRHEPPLGCVLIAYPAVCEPYLVNQFLVRLNKSPFHFSYVFSYHCESKGSFCNKSKMGFTRNTLVTVIGLMTFE